MRNAPELFIVVHAFVVSLVDSCLSGKCKATSAHRRHVQAKKLLLGWCCIFPLTSLSLFWAGSLTTSTWLPVVLPGISLLTMM